MKHLLLVLAVTVAAVASHGTRRVEKGPKPAPAAQRAAQDRAPRPASLVLLYTSSAEGQIRSCNCTKFRYGGYGREMALLKSIRAECPDSVLLEGGDLCGGDGFQAELKADVAAKALELLGYGAIIPGEEELGIRAVRYVDRFKDKPVPVVCANLFKQGEDKPSYRSHITVKTRNGITVGVVGLLDPLIGGALLRKAADYAVKDPLPVLRSAARELRPKTDILVVVYHGAVDGADKLAGVPGVDLVLCTHRGRAEALFPEKDTNVVRAPVKKSGGAFIVESETKMNWSLGRLDLDLANDRGIKDARHSVVYLDRRYEEDPAMVRVFDDYNTRVRDTVLSRSAKFRKEAEVMLTSRGLDPAEMRKRLHKSPFATAEKCRDCHAEVYESWSKTRHAGAMATLEKSQQDYDPECVMCHATGTTVRNGFSNRKDTPELAGVQCEACHGAGLAHVGSPAKGFGRTVGEQVCRSCHTDERTPDFDYAAAWAKIKH